MMDENEGIKGLFEPIERAKYERTSKVDVWIVRRPGETLRRFATQAEAEAYAHSKGWASKITTVRGSARDLFRWGLGPAPEHYRKPPPKPARPRRYKVACPQCPHCLAKRKGVALEPAAPMSWAEYDGPDPSSLRPRSAPSDLEERPDLRGLFDPRLHEDDDTP